jgi:FkbM family methyltransferase
MARRRGRRPAVASTPAHGAPDAGTVRRDPVSGVRFYRLPNGIEVAYHSRAEVEFFYDDIFRQRVYLRHGITLDDGACVFDVGANIGLFTLFVQLSCREPEIFAFEPAPPLFELLRLNSARLGGDVRLFNFGVAERRRRATLTFYPNSSGMSSFHADPAEERQVLEALLNNQLEEGRSGMRELMEHVDDLLEERLRRELFEAELRPLSEVFRSHRVERVDLLKVDVQKAEVEVIAGIEERDWGRIRQIVLEVHDLDGRVEEMRGLLERRGFAVAVEQDAPYGGSNIYNLYGRREPR